MNAVTAFRNILFPGFNLRLKLLLQFQPVFEQVLQPVAQGFLLGPGQPLNLFPNFRSAHVRNLPLLEDAGKSGEHDAGNQHLVADFQRPDFFFGEGKG